MQRHHPRRITRLPVTVRPLSKQTHRDHIRRHWDTMALHIQDRRTPVAKPTGS